MLICLLHVLILNSIQTAVHVQEHLHGLRPIHHVPLCGAPVVTHPIHDCHHFPVHVGHLVHRLPGCHEPLCGDNYVSKKMILFIRLWKFSSPKIVRIILTL